jgi:hypothetical protein
VLGVPFGSVLPAVLARKPKPANPTAGAPTKPVSPSMFLPTLFGTPGQRLGSATLGSPSIGGSMTPHIAMTAAIAGVLARRAVAKTQGTV